MSTSSTSITEDSRQALGQQPTSSLGRHTSWSGHKSTSDGDILTLDSPRGNIGNTTESHVRSLSGHLFGMNLSYSPEPESHHILDSPYEGAPLKSRAGVENHNISELKIIGGSTYPTQQASENVGRKHRRGLSNGKTHPVVAHRRINSGGNAAFINRLVGYDGANTHLGAGPNHQVQSAHHPAADKEQYPPHGQPHHNHWTAHQRRSPPHDLDRRYEYAPPLDERDHYADLGHHPHPHQHPPQSQPQGRRTSPIPPPHHAAPYEGIYRQPRHEDYYSRAPQHGGPPRYQQQRGGRYSPHGNVGQGQNDHLRGSSPDPYSLSSSYSDEVGSNSSSNGHPPIQNHQQYYPPRNAPPMHHGHYPPPPRGGRHPPQSSYPVQYSNAPRNDKRYMQHHPPPPDHPLAEHGLPPHHAEPYYPRGRTSTVDSDGMIETDEKLFSVRDVYRDTNQPRLSSSPRISPQLFESALKGNMMPHRASSSPPEILHVSGMLLGESPRVQSNDTNQHPASTHNRVRSSSSDPQMKQFISAIEFSQTHKRGSSTDSFVFDGNLFGESILEPTPIGPSSSLDLNASSLDLNVDPVAPMPAISVPGATYDAYNIYPDQTKSQSLPSPAYDLNDYSPSGRAEPPQSLEPSAYSPQNSKVGQRPQDNADNEEHQTSNASTKRTRRKCNIGGCTNRVVQGGLCISHGAKRKLCGHAGCTKHVKKAGMCSAHGPPRKLCEFDDCSKVAVQGGRCIAHGARKKLCCVNLCKKQAILAGMCKKHHDQHLEAEAKGNKSRGHRRGLSIDDMNTVNQNSLDDAKQTPTHNRGLSIFTDKEVVEKIITKKINL